MGLIQLLFREPITFFILVVPLLYSVIVHEIAHGWVAYIFGDDTAKRLGRLSPNPIVHFDPMGMIALLFVGFGWARPVPVNYFNFRNFRLGLIFVSLAGCLTNILIATVALFLLKLKYISSNSLITAVLLVFVRINIILGAFNLIPIPPLDGSKILMGFLPSRAQRAFAQLEPYGFLILIVLIFTGLLNPVIVFIQKLIFLFIGVIVNF